jgi:hypothetical protein
MSDPSIMIELMKNPEIKRKYDAAAYDSRGPEVGYQVFVYTSAGMKKDGEKITDGEFSAYQRYLGEIKNKRLDAERK